MKYFNGVRSLKDVKAKYRELSLKYHPDRGGDEDIMKEVNNEYAQLYAVYKNKRNDDWSISDDNMADATETAQSWAGNWYAENGWTGSRYTGYMRGADITKIIRDYAKQKWPQFKFSVTLETYSGGRSIYVSLIGSPYPLNADGTNENRYGSNFYHTRMWKDTEGMNERVRVAFCDVVEYMDSYNYDHSDSMEDYFDVNFYTHISVGTSKRPYEQTNTLSGGAAFKWKDGPAHKALKKALGGGGAMFKEYSMRRGTFVLYGEMHYYSEEPHFYPKEYSQPSVIKRVMERMTECGLIVKQCGSAIEFVGYTPEMERALAQEAHEREAVYQRWLAGEKEPKIEKPKTKTAQEPIADGETVTVEEYSEKSVVLKGDLRKAKDVMKNEFHAIWLAKVGAWCVSKKSVEKVTNRLKECGYKVA